MKHDKIYWCWRKDDPEKREQFPGNTFFYARKEAAKHFGVEPTRVDGELVPEKEIKHEES